MYGLKRVLFSENIPLLLYHCWAKVFCFIASFLRIFFSFTYWCLLFCFGLVEYNYDFSMWRYCEERIQVDHKIWYKRTIVSVTVLFWNWCKYHANWHKYRAIFTVLYCKYSIGDQIRFQDTEPHFIQHSKQVFFFFLIQMILQLSLYSMRQLRTERLTTKTNKKQEQNSSEIEIVVSWVLNI